MTDRQSDLPLRTFMRQGWNGLLRAVQNFSSIVEGLAYFPSSLHPGITGIPRKLQAAVDLLGKCYWLPGIPTIPVGKNAVLIFDI